jgi:hypothetical protein
VENAGFLQDGRDARGFVIYSHTNQWFVIGILGRGGKASIITKDKHTRDWLHHDGEAHFGRIRMRQLHAFCVSFTREIGRKTAKLAGN